MGVVTENRVRWESALRRALIALAAIALPALFAAPAFAAPTFAPATNYSEGAVPFGTSITTADFDADGNLELLYEVSPSGLRLRKGDGAGGFGAFTVVPSTGLSQDFNSVYTAQLNPDVDSFPDVVVTPGGTPANDNLVLLINNDDGTFSETVLSLGLKTRAHAAAVGDLNGDGDPDIAVTTSAPAGATDNLAIFFGDGSGAFGFAGYVDHGGQLESSTLANRNDVALGYLNADVVLDIVVANEDSGSFAVLLGQGDGLTFDPAVTYGMGGTEPRAIVLRDLDGDGELDVATLNRGSNDIGVRLGIGNGSFGPALTYGLGGGTGGQHLLAVDINDDGVLDLVTTNQGTNDFSVLLGNGDGSFDTGVRFGTPNNPYEAVAGDFDEDGRPDIATTGGAFSASTGFIKVRRNTTDEKAPNTFIDSNPADPTNSTTANFTFHGTDPAIASLPLSFECRRDGAAWNPCDTTSSDNDTATEGQRTFEVRAIDTAGNADPTPASYTWAVDLTPPTITVTTPKAGPPHDHFELHDGAPAFSCSDPLAGAPPVASGVDDCGASSFDDDIPLGPKLITFTATDNAGNVSTPVTRVYVIDPPNYGEFVNDDDPVAYYRFDEPYPSSQSPQEIGMEDSSGNGHHGTYKNDVALRRQGGIACERRPHPPRACESFANDPDRPGWAAFFPERDGYGYVNGISASPTGYTMEAWVKPRTPGAMMIMSHGRAGQLFIDGSGRLAFEQSQDTVSGGGPVLDTGSWWHVAATWDGHHTRLYVNGDEVAHSTTANATPSGISTFYVGYGERAPWFHGEIDEAALYNHALSRHAFEDRYAIGTAKDKPSLPGHAGNDPLNTGLPSADPTEPKNNGLYAPGKTAQGRLYCTIAMTPHGHADIASCTATADGGTIGQIAGDAAGRARTARLRGHGRRSGLATPTFTRTPMTWSTSPRSTAATLSSPTTASATAGTSRCSDSSPNGRTTANTRTDRPGAGRDRRRRRHGPRVQGPERLRLRERPARSGLPDDDRGLGPSPTI